MSVSSKFSDGKITVPSLLQRKSLPPQDSTKIKVGKNDAVIRHHAASANDQT